jgi:glutamine amidotransferase
MITIVDYGMGNLRSVFNALTLLGQDVQITSDPDEILSAERLILPGVGAFGLAMHNLRERGLIDPLNEKVIAQQTPILAICLGMQLLAESSNEHGQHDGLGWIPGRVKLFELDDLKSPHVGWNDIAVQGDPPLFRGLGGNKEFYFVHSYHFETDETEVVAATTDYGYDFVAAVHRDNIFGTQFHPEKSQDNGLRVLRNFIAWQPVLAPA